MGLQVRFGNTAPVQVTRDEEDNLVRTELAHADAEQGESVSEFQIPDDLSLAEAFIALTAPGGAWEYHSDEHPAWVSVGGDGDPSTAKMLGELLGEHFGCEVRKHDAKVVTAFGDPTVAKPAAHRAGLAAHAAKLGVKGGAVDDAADETKEG